VAVPTRPERLTVEFAGVWGVEVVAVDGYRRNRSDQNEREPSTPTRVRMGRRVLSAPTMEEGRCMVFT